MSDKNVKLGSLQPNIDDILQWNDLPADAFESASSEEKANFIQDRKSVSYWKDAWRRLRKNTVAMVALVIIIFLCLFAFVGPSVVPYSYKQQIRGAEALDPWHILQTGGSEIKSGAQLSANHRYLVAEDTTARFAVSGKSAVLNYCGLYVLSPSAATDYPAMAGALRALGLFRGSDTGYGSGFDLGKEPTRMEALIMLIRLLGEEDAALRCTASHPFTDVPGWANAYAAYAYSMGYSNGMSAATFGTTTAASAEMYTEFLLRALRYSSTAQIDITDAPERAYFAGVLTAGEVSALRTGTFLRADVVYLSYYALETNQSGGGALSDALIARGVFTADAYRASRAAVTSERIR